MKDSFFDSAKNRLPRTWRALKEKAFRPFSHNKQPIHPCLAIKANKGAGTNEVITPLYIPTSTKTTMPNIGQDRLTGKFLATSRP